MPEPLTVRQRQVLDAIVAHIRDQGFPPSVRGLGALVGGHPSSLHFVLDQLVAKGWITRTPGVARGIRVVHLQEVTGDG